MPKYNEITREKFALIKAVSKSVGRKEAANLCGVSEVTVTRVSRVESFEEYKQNTGTRRPAAQETAANAETKQTIVVQASHYMLEEQKKTNELLTAISNKLAFIVVELTGAGENAEQGN